MEYIAYTLILFGTALGLFALEIIIFLLLPNGLVVKLIEQQFGIKKSGKKESLMNFYGMEIDLLSARRFRWSLICQLAGTVLIILLLFIHGWLIRIENLTDRNTCPTQTSDCFVYRSILSNYPIHCEPGQPFSNWTSLKLICFVWIYEDAKAIDMLNQLGICSSVFTLLCHSFRWMCRLSRKWFGLILIILWAFVCIAMIILSYSGRIRLSLTGLLLFIGFCCLFINVTQLYQFTRHYKKEIRPPRIAKSNNRF